MKRYSMFYVWWILYTIQLIYMSFFFIFHYLLVKIKLINKNCSHWVNIQMVHYFTHEYFQVSKYFNLTLCSFQHGFFELIYLNIKNPPSVSIRDFDRGYKTLVGVKIED